MFGYIRPLQSELKVRELERFKACYCGLCHALGREYGLAARLMLNYELVFLAMLLWTPDDNPVIKLRRCIAGPFRKRRYCCRNASLDTCAGYSVILSWWKLQDTLNDEHFIKSIPHRVASLFLSGAYKKAVRNYPEFDGKVREEVAKLAEYEELSGHSLDGAADKFAQIISAAAPELSPESVRRPMLEFLYHLGRWIYIVDACDDYSEDIKKGRYNAVAVRFPPESGIIPEEGTVRLKTTLSHSNNLLCLAFELLPENTWSDIIRNMIYLGMPDVIERVIGQLRVES